MATAASSYYSEDDRPLNQGAQVDRTGSYAGNLGTTGRHSMGVQSAGSSVDYEPANANEEHRIRRGLMPTSEGAPQVHPVRGTSHIPEGETHTGLVGTDGRPLTQAHHQDDLNARDHHQSTGTGLAGLASGHNNSSNNNELPQGEEYAARDEGLEPYSAPPPALGQATSGAHPTSGYLPEKKIGPAVGETGQGQQLHHNNQDSSTAGHTGIATAGHSDDINNNNNKQSILADPSHPDNVLVQELEERARKSGTHAVGFGTHGDEEPPLAHGGYDNDASHLRDTNESGKHLAAGTFSRGGNTFDNEGDHTDTEAPDMQPSQSYIQRQSLYSQPPSTRAGDNANGEPLTQEKLNNQSYGQQQAPFSSRDYGHGGDHHLVPAGGGVIRPVAGVLPRDAESGALARNYEPSSYTQPGMAGVGAGGLAGGALAGGALGSGASAVGTGHPDTAQYIQEPGYEQQQHDDKLAPQAQQMQNYPSQQTQRTQQTQQTAQSYGTAPGLQHDNDNNERQHQLQQQRSFRQDGDLNNSNQQKRFIPAPMPVFQSHPNQESQLHEDLPGQQQQPQQQVSQLNNIPGEHQQQGQYQQQQPFQQQQQPEQQQLNGPTTAVPVVPAHTGAAQSVRESNYPQSTASRPISGGGLGAAIATAGHEPTKLDKKALKKEIKSERKFEKSLTEQAKKEGQEIEMAMKMAKLSMKKADKSGRYEANYRSTYEKAIKKEIAAKQRLLRVTNEYNKVAADLERVNKEMEIRRNAHIADVQTRDADADRVADLRKLKGQHDMEREARHGDSLVKQKQAKRALSMSSKRKSSLF